MYKKLEKWCWFNIEVFNNLRVLLIVMQSVVDALPLGILICSDANTAALIRGITILKFTALMNNHFIGKDTMVLTLQ